MVAKTYAEHKPSSLSRRDLLTTTAVSVVGSVTSQLVPSSVLAAPTPIKSYNFEQIRSRLLQGLEIALLDVREEIPHADGHPLFAASFPVGNIELNAFTFLPRKQMPIVLIDNGEGLAAKAANKFIEIGYTDVGIFQGGINAWAKAGGQLFQDINVPSKSFGEVVLHDKKTPLINGKDQNGVPGLNSLKESGQAVVLDVRRPDEYNTFRIPGAISEPGTEVVLNFNKVVPNDQILVVTNCAGRTRGLIWAQTLINCGVSNPVKALDGGTIKWFMSGLQLEDGPPTGIASGCSASCNSHFIPQASARQLADRAGVKRTDWTTCLIWQTGNVSNTPDNQVKTTYFFDVRSEAAYAVSHLPGFRCAPGGEVVQELMMYAPSRGSRIVLVDDDGVQANIAASWLKQMNCDVWVLDGAPAFTEKGPWQSAYPAPPTFTPITSAALAEALSSNQAIVIDLSPLRFYQAGHVPGAWFALRSQLATAATNLPISRRGNQKIVLTDQSGRLAAYAAPELQQVLGKTVYVLTDEKDLKAVATWQNAGNAAWKNAGYNLQKGPTNLASPAIDRFQRPYEAPEGEDVAPDQDVTFNIDKINAYLAWLSGSNLLTQLQLDGTSGFHTV